VIKAYGPYNMDTGSRKKHSEITYNNIGKIVPTMDKENQKIEYDYADIGRFTRIIAENGDSTTYSTTTFDYNKVLSESK
jgi:hypothetical protein